MSQVFLCRHNINEGMRKAVISSLKLERDRPSLDEICPKGVIKNQKPVRSCICIIRYCKNNNALLLDTPADFLVGWLSLTSLLV